MKILVTGGAGFIGSNFLHYYAKKHDDYEIVCLDDLTYAGNFNNIIDLVKDKKIRFVKGNIVDRKFVFDLFKKEHFDLVINFAAESHVTNSIDYPDVFFMTNVIGTQVLLDASRKYKVARFHQVSTDEVYGSLELDDDVTKFVETSPLKGSTPYSASKASADLLCLAYYHTYNYPITISRCSNNYGYYQFPEKLIPLVINNVLNNKKVPVHGLGEHIRDWIFVDDHIRGIELVLEKGKLGEIYNFCGDREIPTIEIVNCILEKMGKNPKEWIDNVPDRLNNDKKYSIDSTKAMKELGWKRETEFEDGIDKTISWYTEHKDWLDAITSGDYQNVYDDWRGSK